MSCQRQLNSLEDCVRKHPRESEYVCRHLHAAAAWCLVAHICPAEVEGVEACIGPRRSRLTAPGSIPRKCRAAMDRLEACIEMHQDAAADGLVAQT
ncbi:hypothetical protein WJX72_002769 [[Myrmecia] bisecta]|uniref:COX assembly mitochondrial protein n=1 Tax=[Myrmecia] bisecta TaxID=41462 RepID=A0AAW1Q2S0_9CHLO